MPQNLNRRSSLRPVRHPKIVLVRHEVRKSAREQAAPWIFGSSNKPTFSQRSQVDAVIAGIIIHSVVVGLEPGPLGQFIWTSDKSSGTNGLKSRACQFVVSWYCSRALRRRSSRERCPPCGVRLGESLGEGGVGRPCWIAFPASKPYASSLQILPIADSHSRTVTPSLLNNGSSNFPGVYSFSLDRIV